jgi:hypothetical protein
VTTLAGAGVVLVTASSSVVVVDVTVDLPAVWLHDIFTDSFRTSIFNAACELSNESSITSRSIVSFL